ITEDVNRTFVMGESMGGYGTLKCALTHPERYGKAVCLSGSNVIDLPFDSFNKLFAGNFGTYEKLKQSNDNLANVIPSFNKAVHKPDIMFYCGTEDFVYPGCKAFYEQLKENCPDANIEAEWWHGQHNFFFWNEAIPKALRYFGFEVRQNSVI
ncbi:MAG: prolyl oligopeptidase family serine peptidase, partial [Erysipelotrichaceae bacterium]|nr:prolyl oligopeptidase family serine peptidase [Erysipelotrichaceae bacterium]